MELNRYVIHDLIEYYKNQIFKILGLYESKDENGYKFAIRISSELNQLPSIIPELNNDYRFIIVLMKVDILTEELYFLDGKHRFVKNHVMESLNILDQIKEGLLNEYDKAND